MNVDYIITTINKTKEEITSLLLKSNISGNILIGNQGSINEFCYEIYDKGFRAKVYNQTTKGVSINRNYLLQKSNADYVIFLDDDVTLNKHIILGDNYQNNVAIRFNCLSKNIQRPIKQICSKKFLKFSDVKSFGVWGIFFNRHYLINNNLFFNENVGPGKYINHGEDTLFLKKYLKSKGKLLQINEQSFFVSQEVSTWKDGNIERELISHGYIYKKIFGFKGFLYLYYYAFKHRCEYIINGKKAKISYLLKYLKKGFKLKDNELKNMEETK